MFDDIFGGLFGDKPKPKKPHEQAYELGQKWAELAERFKRINQKKEQGQ